jgi:hypothetical protein
MQGFWLGSEGHSQGASSAHSDFWWYAQRNGTERQELVLKPGDAERSSDLRPRFKFEPQNGHSKFWSRQLGEVSTAPMFVPVHTVRVAATNETFAIQTPAAKRLIPTRVKYILATRILRLGKPLRLSLASL